MSSSAVAQVAVVLLAVARGRPLDTTAMLGQPMAGGTVLSATLRHAQASRLPLTVVAHAGWRLPLLEHGVAPHQVVTVAAGAGLGEAIAAGVTSRPNADGWLVLPADMPGVAPETLRALAAALRDAPMIYPEYRGQRGQPMGFASELCSDLLRLTDDDSVRRLLARFPARGVPLGDPGVLLRVRQSADLAAAEQRMQALTAAS